MRYKGHKHSLDESDESLSGIANRHTKGVPRGISRNTIDFLVSVMMMMM